MTANVLAPLTRIGDDFQAFVDKIIERQAETSREIGLIR